MVHYLDYAATSPMKDAAIAAMLPLLQDRFGNPSGAHRLARRANRIVDDAREVVAAALGFKPGEIIFTSGGTEANNTAIFGVNPTQGRPPLCSAVEHHAVLDPVLHSGGSTVGVDAQGRVDVGQLDAVLAERTANDRLPSIVSIMAVNNESGVIQPVSEVARRVRQFVPDAVIHSDAVQALCWTNVAETCAEIDSVSISAHKFGGPKGVGALAVRGAAAGLSPLLRGGSQERERRGGTHNVAGIAAMAAAITETVNQRNEVTGRVRRLRDRLSDHIATIPGAIETGGANRNHKVESISHFCFEGIESEALLFMLEKNDIMASAASSCASGAAEPSHVLTAMGYSRDLAFGSLRLSLGYQSTDADVDAVIDCLPAAVARLRARG